MKTTLRILIAIFLPLSKINITYAQTNFWEEMNTGLVFGMCQQVQGLITTLKGFPKDRVLTIAYWTGKILHI